MDDLQVRVMGTLLLLQVVQEVLVRQDTHQHHIEVVQSIDVVNRFVTLKLLELYLHFPCEPQRDCHGGQVSEHQRPKHHLSRDVVNAVVLVAILRQENSALNGGLNVEAALRDEAHDAPQEHYCSALSLDEGLIFDVADSVDHREQDAVNHHRDQGH